MVDGYKVETIGNNAFEDCLSLTKIVIPDSVKVIQNLAFYNCTNLADIIIPDSVEMIYTGSFHGTKWLVNQPDGIIYAGKVAYDYKGKMPENTEIKIREGIKTIGSGAFEGCTGLSEITLPESVTSINSNAFEGCSKSLSIKGYDGSYAQKYANEQNINFTALEKKDPVDITPEITKGLPGDANNDGIVSAVDMVWIMKYILMKSEIVINKDNCDLNSDGVVNVIDFQKLKIMFLEN